MLNSRNVRDSKGVGYMTGLKYSAYIRVWKKVKQTNPEARLVGYMKGEAIQKRSGGDYYSAQDLMEIANQEIGLK